MTIPARGARTSVTTGARGSAARSGIAALRPDPALVGLACRAVRHRLLGAFAALFDIDAEIRQREQARTRVEDELRQVRRPFPDDRLGRLAHLEGVPDRRAERLVHVREEADHLASRTLAEVDHLLGEDARVVERSS